jgi:hypothetical protein
MLYATWQFGEKFWMVGRDCPKQFSGLPRVPFPIVIPVAEVLSKPGLFQRIQVGLVHWRDLAIGELASPNQLLQLSYRELVGEGSVEKLALPVLRDTPDADGLDMAAFGRILCAHCPTDARSARSAARASKYASVS